MHSRITLYLLKSKKSIACQSVTIMNEKERFVIFPNHTEIMGNGILISYVDLSNGIHNMNQKGIFHFEDSKFFFI